MSEPMTPPDDSPEAREAALEAVRTLLRWVGEDPTREGLHDTPRRVVDAYLEYFRPATWREPSSRWGATTKSCSSVISPSFPTANTI